ncbi:MAG: hypothetical protein ABWY36_05635 [Leifsonia sp.]
MISIPRGVVIALGAIFSLYHVVLGLYSLDTPASPEPAVLALAMYVVATVVSLWPTRELRLAIWASALDLAVAIAMPLLVCSQLDPAVDNGYATWYVAASGTLMTIAAVRRRVVIAWLGVLFLAVQTVIWSGVEALGMLGVIGSIVWVAVAHLATITLAQAGRDAASLAEAEREAAAWQAAQDAHNIERRIRLEQTQRIAAPMLRRIVAEHGRLDAEEREECRRLEAATRDEIRGRMLLDDAVRSAVLSARSRGAAVSLLDEGGLDDLDASALRIVHARLAAAIVSTDADRIIARTAQGGSPVAVTVVGLSAADADAEEEDDVRLWLEIPRDRNAAEE